MRKLRIFAVLVAWAGFSGLAGQLYAQNPPFQNPSLDSNCYFPQIGVPGEIDTIYGSQPNEGLGDYIHNLGAKPDGSFGNMLIGKYDSPTGAPPDIFSIAPTGQNFNLHNLHAVAQTLKINREYIRFGHFRDRNHLDIFDEDAWRIYWADDNGNYDTSRYTNLESNVYGSQGISMNNPLASEFYTAHLTSDTIDDIVVGFNTFESNPANNSPYLALFKGGETLYQKSIAFEDTSIPLSSYPNRVQNWIQGDFRGTGRDDLIIADYYDNVLFFKNDPPFLLQSLKNAMLFDTLWSTASYPAWRNSNVIWPDLDLSLVSHILPKEKGDRSSDWLVSIPTTNDSNNGIFIFRGGPDFGSHRITIDSAAYVILPPALGYPMWPNVLCDAGDLTGTGNHVLYTFGWDRGYGWQNYYLTGQALDNKIDMYYSGMVVLGDTLTANDDSLEDLLLGNSSYSIPNDSVGHGTMWLLYGSKQIPVHLNPQFADVVNIPKENGTGISLSPNPVTRGWSVATILWPVSEDGEYSIYNMLGQRMEHGPIHLYGGAEQQRIYFSGMPQGVYIYEIEGAHGSASTRIVKLGGANGSSGSSQPNIIQQMKDARDGRTIPAELSSPSPEILR